MGDLKMLLDFYRHILAFSHGHNSVIPNLLDFLMF